MSLCHFVTIGLGGGGVKANLDNVTKYEVFFFEGFPNINQGNCIFLRGEQAYLPNETIDNRSIRFELKF